MNHNVLTRVLVAILSTALGIAIWSWFAPKQLQGSASVRIDVAAPSAAPVGLDDLLQSQALLELERTIEGVRDASEHTAKPQATAAMPREQFESRYQRGVNSRMRTFVAAPQLVRAEKLVRDPALNPKDIVLPAREVELLDRLVESHRAVIEAVHKSRSVEAHRLALQMMREQGVLSVTALLPQLPPEAIEHINVELRKSDPQDKTFEQTRRKLETDAVRAEFGGDVAVFHRGQAYLAPTGSVRPHLRDFDDFLHVRGLLMASDVLTIFLRNGALTTTEFTSLLAALEDATTTTLASGD